MWRVYNKPALDGSTLNLKYYKIYLHTRPDHKEMIAVKCDHEEGEEVLMKFVDI